MKLIIYPNEVLRAPTKRISLFDDALRGVAQEMAKVMLKSRGIGLAAPQVGLSRKMILCWDGEPETKILVLCNPEIILTEGESDGTEGCLSFPGKWYEITRPSRVICRYQDLRGKFQKIEATGIMARCILHEAEHLDGILIIDHKEEEDDS